MRTPFRKSVGKRIGTGRYRKRRFRRDYALFLAPVALALLLLAAVTQNAELLASAWRDPATVLEERSPGERDPGALYSTKPERILARVLPAERVLPVVRERFAPEEAPLADEFGFDEPALAAFAPEIVEDLPLPPPPPVLTVSTVPDGLPPPTVPGAVPEPATWLVSILGLFAVAGAMRRRNRKIPNAAVPAGA